MQQIPDTRGETIRQNLMTEDERRATDREPDVAPRGRVTWDSTGIAPRPEARGGDAGGVREGPDAGAGPRVHVGLRRAVRQGTPRAANLPRRPTAVGPWHSAHRTDLPN